MNLRIKELAEQCESFGSWDNKTYSFDKEKFAELIVRECADYFGREGDRRFEVDGNWIANTIKRNFGVE